MGKPLLENLSEVMGEGPAWDRKQLEEMDPAFRNKVHDNLGLILKVSNREELEEAFRLFDREGDGEIETQVYPGFDLESGKIFCGRS